MMAINAQNILLIEKYIDGVLSAAEKQIFDAQIASNTEFKAEVQAYETALKAIRVGGHHHILSILAEEEAKITVKKDDILPISMSKVYVKPFIMRHWRLAAAGIAILAVVVFMIPTPSKNDYTEVKPPRNLWITVGRGHADEQYLKSMYGEEKAQQLSMGFEAYQADKFKEAAHILSQLNIEKDSLYFYRGNANLQIKETDKAIQDFNKIMDDKSSQLKQQTEWYLLRAYLQNNKTAQAKKLQQIIINEPNHPFKVEASELKIE